MFGGVGVAGRVGPLLQLTTRAAALPPVSVVVLGLLVGVYNVFIFFPFLVRFIPGFRSNFPSIYYRPVSDSPVSTVSQTRGWYFISMLIPAIGIEMLM